MRRGGLVLLLSLFLGGCSYYYQQPEAPVAAFIADPRQGPPPLSVQFDATASQPSTGAEIVGYEWDFGDGSYGLGATTSHVYALAGTYRVTLTIEDSAGQSDSAWCDIVVGNAPPVIYSIELWGELSGPGPTFKRGEEIEFAAVAEDPDGYIRLYRWDFGDGAVGRGPTVIHAYYPPSCSKPEAYIVTLWVEDNTGQVAVATVEIEVTCR